MGIKVRLQELGNRLRHDFVSEAFWLTVTAVLSGPAMSVWAYVQGVPLPFVVFLGVAMCASAFLLLNQWQQWRFRNDPEGKVHYLRLRVDAIKAGGKDIGKEDELNAWVMKVGFDVINTATFPIEYKVVRLWTAIDGQAPKNVDRWNHGSVLEPKESTYFFDSEILIGTRAVARYRCDMDYEFRYGRPGDLRFTQKRRVSAHVMIDSKKGIVNVSAYGVPEPA